METKNIRRLLEQLDRFGEEPSTYNHRTIKAAMAELAEIESRPTPRAADGANRRCPECNALLEVSSVYCDACGTDTPAANACR